MLITLHHKHLHIFGSSMYYHVLPKIAVCIIIFVSSLHILFVAVMQKHDVSNLNADERTEQTMESVGNGQPEKNSGAVDAVSSKPVTDVNDAKSQSDIKAAKLEEPVREKPDTNGSSSPAKRKLVGGRSDSESEDHGSLKKKRPISGKSDIESEDCGSPKKKQRSEPAEHSSDDEDAMSEEDDASSPKTRPKKRKSTRGFASDEDLARVYGSTLVEHAFSV